MLADRGWWRAPALVMVIAGSGCVERVIHDVELVADGDGGIVDTGTSTGPGDTEQYPGESTSTGPVATTDPDVECTIPQDCGDGQTCYQGVCVGTGSVRVSLSWNVVTDLDLHVRVPNGEWISYEVPVTSYGQLDVDDCVAGACVNQNGTHVENVFLDANAPRGSYGVMIVNFDGRHDADYAVEVAGDVSAQFAGYLPATMSVEGTVHEFYW